MMGEFAKKEGPYPPGTGLVDKVGPVTTWPIDITHGKTYP